MSAVGYRLGCQSFAFLMLCGSLHVWSRPVRVETSCTQVTAVHVSHVGAARSLGQLGREGEAGYCLVGKSRSPSLAGLDSDISIIAGRQKWVLDRDGVYIRLGQSRSFRTVSGGHNPGHWRAARRR